MAKTDNMHRRTLVWFKGMTKTSIDKLNNTLKGMEAMESGMNS